MHIPPTFRWLSLAVVSASAIVLFLTHFASTSGRAQATPVTLITSIPEEVTATKNKIQMAFLLDTSGSMDGLIDQARARMWSILNEAMEVERNGQEPDIEVALYEYGNDRLSARNGYIKQIVPLTSNVDSFSQKLFALSTSGGDEFCPMAIQKAAEELAWDMDPGTTKFLYIAGNENFNQGTVNPADGIKAACEKDILVNIIYCGDPNDGVGQEWNKASALCDGDFFAINQDAEVQYVASPYDDRIERANTLLNSTYVPINAVAEAELQNQAAQDRNAAQYSKANLSSRAKFKASKNYKANNWDLVDAAEDDVQKIIKEKEALPDSLSTLSDAELQVKIGQLAEERKRLKSELKALANQRDNYVAEAKKSAAVDQSNTLGEKIKRSVKNQLIKKGYQEKAKVGS